MAGLTIEMLYQPMEFEWGGPGRDRIAAQFATHLVSHVTKEAVPLPVEPAQPQPEPTCSALPAPVIDEYYRFDEADLGNAPCSAFKYALPGLFGFSWDEVPGAAKYRVKLSGASGQLYVYNRTLDRNDARCDGTKCSLQMIPPIALAPGCTADDGTTLISGYFLFVSAINSCGDESDPGVGAAGYIGPH